MSTKLECQYRVNKDMMLKLEGGNQKELFEAMASAAEIFGAHWECCGRCKNASFKPRPVVRLNTKKQKFFELHCTNPACRARFAFGQNQDSQTLFPQRKFAKSHPQTGQYKPDGGWVKYVKEEDDAPPEQEEA